MPRVNRLIFAGCWIVAAGVWCAEGARAANEAAPRATEKEERARTAEARIGERLFAEPRFAQWFFARSGGKMNAALTAGDPVLATQAVAETAGDGGRARPMAGPLAGQTMSCRACHLGGELRGRAGLPAQGVGTLGDFVARSPVPERGDGLGMTPRNSPPLVDALAAGGGDGVLHYDGEFATVEALVQDTFTGRNFGWLPPERVEAQRHFARVIRGAADSGGPERDGGGWSYAVLLAGVEERIPPALRLPEAFRLDVARAGDDEILGACARLVAAFLHSLRFSRDPGGQHDGSPYDAFLAVNRLPRAPAPGQTPHEYARRLSESVAALRAPRFVDDAARRLQLHDQPFRFGETELRGLRIFFRGAIGASQQGGAGNCAECHVPPRFTDFALHNTGVAQDDYDARHGGGTFARLEVPGLAARAADPDRWLPPTPLHPRASGIFLSAADGAAPGRTDLGGWNVYANPAFPAPQAMLERLLNASGTLKREEVLARSVGRFKTPALRDLGQSAPYQHTGGQRTLEEVVGFYQRASALAREGKLRNAPPEFFGVRLEAADVEPLVAFLRALNEDYIDPR